MGKGRFLAGVGLSLLFHATAIAWLVSRPLPAAPAARPLQLVLVEVDLPPAPPEPPKPAEPPRPAPPLKQPRTAPVVAAPTPEQLAEAPPPPVSDAPTADAPVADAPRREAIPLPSQGFALELDAGVRVAEEQGGLRAPAISTDLVGELTRETIGRGKVDRGLVHPYYSQLGKALLKTWDADRAVSSAGLKGFADQVVENSKAWNNIWQEKAQVFGKSGSPFDAPVTERGKPLNDRLIPGQDLQARREVQREMAKQFRSTRRAQIRVTQDANGRLTKVELVKPSNDSNVDQQALTDVRAAAEKLPPPPEEALGGKPTLISLWEFELVVSISPPVPTFTFEFDEALGFIDARLPLDRRIYKKVRLVSVE